MRVKELWRYPVKSLQGERVAAAEVLETGLHGDRRYALFDAETGMGLSGRRHPELLFASARLAVDGALSIRLPDGTVLSGGGEADEDALSRWLGRRVVLRSTDEVESRTFEGLDDNEHEETSAWHPFDAAEGSFQDTEGAAVSIVSEESLGIWAQRRFRPNIVVTGGGEDALAGHRVTVGFTTLRVGDPLGRCVMVTRPQPGGIEKDLGVLRTIHRERGGKLAMRATVAVPGLVSEGDELELR